MPALTPEERMVPLVDQSSASQRSEADDNAAATNTNPPLPGAGPEATKGPLPTQVQPIGV